METALTGSLHTGITTVLSFGIAVLLQSADKTSIFSSSSLSFQQTSDIGLVGTEGSSEPALPSSPWSPFSLCVPPCPLPDCCCSLRPAVSKSTFLSSLAYWKGLCSVWEG